MSETAMDRSSTILYYLWLPFLLPAHTWRLATLRLISHRTTYALRLGMQEDLEVLRDTIRTARQMEQEMADMDLTLDCSRQAALDALRAATARLAQRVRAGFRSADSKTPE